MHKVFKNKAQGCSTPLRSNYTSISLYGKTTIFMLTPTKNEKLDSLHVPAMKLIG